MPPEAVRASLARGFSWLERSQLPNGEVLLETSLDPLLVREVQPVPNFITTAYAIESLLAAGFPPDSPFMRRAFSFIESGVEPGGLARFWPRTHGLLHIPLDVDTTAVLSSVLRAAGRAIDNRELLLSNRSACGGFYTWILPRRFRLWPDLRSEWKFLLPANPFWRTEALRDEVCWGATANVLAWLGEDDETMPAIRQIVALVDEGREATCDRWYLSPVVCRFLFSRAARLGAHSLDEVSAVIAARTCDALAKGSLGSLETALAVLTLLNFKRGYEAVPVAVDALLARQHADGSWNREPFFWGGPLRKRVYGSRAVTTFFTLEAVARGRGDAA